jgi:phage gp29-like protein
MSIVKTLVNNTRDAVRILVGKPPIHRQNWLGPRFEPSNISSYAKVSTIQEAIREAENGDPTTLFRFYRDALLGDEHIQGELGKRKLAVLGEPLVILPRDKENREDIAAAAACLQAVEDCENWGAGLSALLGASQWPVAIVENIFQPANAAPVRFSVGEEKGELRLQYTLKRLEPVNPMLFCYRHAYLVGGVGLGTASPIQQAGLMKEAQQSTWKVGTSPWYMINLDDWEPFLRLWPIDEAGRIIYDASNASKLDSTRHIVHRGHLITDQRDNWGGPMRAISAWWLLRGLGRDWFARFMERYGSPFPVGKTNVDDPQAVDFLREAFNLATKIGGLVIGDDDSVELQQAMVQGGAEGHKIWHDVCNDAISFHITGYKSSQKPAGLNAGEATTTENIREDIRVFDEKTLGETLVKQLFRNFQKFNGLTGSIRIVWGGLSIDDAATFAALLKTMGEAGLEPTDESMPVVDEKTGLQWQRKAVPAPLDDDPAAGPKGPDEDDAETLSTRDGLGRLICFSAGGGPRRHDPVDGIVARRKEALVAAYKGAMAPFRQAILSSNSKEECLAKLHALYSDWSPERLASELDAALQICAAAGAARAVEG